MRNGRSDLHDSAEARGGGADDQATKMVLALLGRRDAQATVCPSEVARALAAARGEDDWRARMDAVHGAVDGLVSDGRVRLSWKGEPIAVRGGPYRIGRPD